MTIDEATQILNIKKGAFKEESELQKMLKVRVFHTTDSLWDLGPARWNEFHRANQPSPACSARQ